MLFPIDEYVVRGARVNTRNPTYSVGQNNRLVGQRFDCTTPVVLQASDDRQRTERPPPDWSALSQAERDAAYDNNKAAANSPAR
jgi:hypothetical protein